MADFKEAELINKKSNILLTGGSGFIGRCFAEDLIKTGCRLTALFNKNLPKTNNSKSVNYVECDMLDMSSLKSIMEIEDFDYIFHFAGHSNANSSIDEAFDTISNNILITINLLEALRFKKIKGVLFTSSSKVYSNINSKNLSESEEIKPISSYATSKYCCENIIRSYSHSFNIPSIILRVGSVFGRNDRNLNHLIPSLINSTQDKGEVQLKTNIKKQIDFVYIDHLCDFLINLDSSINKMTDKSSLINFSSYQESIKEAISIFEDISKTKIKFSETEEDISIFENLMETEKLGYYETNKNLLTFKEALKETFESNI
tara:strand:+ start:1488 stop:2438 length:951 start_codon:yes stop_codon:yes gene_type:complete